MIEHACSYCGLLFRGIGERPPGATDEMARSWNKSLKNHEARCKDASPADRSFYAEKRKWPRS